MGVVTHHHIRSQLQELEIAVPGVGDGQAGELLASVGDHDAPAAPCLDLVNAALDGIQVIPAENARLGGCGGDTLVHIGNAEHTDAASFVQIDRLGGLCLVEAGANGAAAQVGGDLPGADDALTPGVHGVVVADGPDIRVNILQDPGCFGVHTVEKHAPGAVIHRIDQRALHVGHRVVRAVEKVQHRLGKQSIVLPTPVHIPVKADVSRENNGRFVLFHPLHSLTFLYKPDPVQISSENPSAFWSGRDGAAFSGLWPRSGGCAHG